MLALLPSVGKSHTHRSMAYPGGTLRGGPSTAQARCGTAPCLCIDLMQKGVRTVSGPLRSFAHGKRAAVARYRAAKGVANADTPWRRKGPSYCEDPLADAAQNIPVRMPQRMPLGRARRSAVSLTDQVILDG